MIKYVLMLALILTGSFANAGECVNGSCRNFRNKVVNVTTEIVSVPVFVTRKTIEVTRNTGRKTINRLRSIVK
jgi:hypothetical protein